MAQQIKFYNKNFIDIDNTAPTITITDAVATSKGESYVDYMLNRNNTSGWRTTGSTDAANTQLDIDMVDTYSIDRILLVKHNLKAFTIQYYNGATYVDFSTPINETTNTETTNEFSFDAASTSKIRVVITACQVTNEDKLISQLIVTSSLGQFEGWPQIKKPTMGRNKKTTKLLSGKSLVSRQVGNFSCELEVENWNINNDLALLESLYFAISGFLMWINAGDSDQFSRANMGYRDQDIFLVFPTNEYSPQFYKFYYNTGIKIKMALTEVVK